MTQFVFRRDNTCLNKDTREELLLVEPRTEPGTEAEEDQGTGSGIGPDAGHAVGEEPAP
ncbi:hypothetical protein AB0M35_02240 [Micromonospora sp. NPDC051196]|uniref:hypothetical protein n=1 Tax=Micromonospora sp. NPDC051196 TaxID=3155281 RepID=UPI0034257D95